MVIAIKRREETQGQTIPKASMYRHAWGYAKKGTKCSSKELI